MAKQFATQLNENCGGKLPRSMQPSAQVTTCRQPLVWHGPQSAGQLMHVSYSSDSHLPLPQTEQTPQSYGHDAHVSLPEHEPSPQPGHLPQSFSHKKQLSLNGSQKPSPQPGHLPQSGAHERHVSAPVQ
jgi:hypothetical protein